MAHHQTFPLPFPSLHRRGILCMVTTSSGELRSRWPGLSKKTAVGKPPPNLSLLIVRIIQPHAVAWPAVDILYSSHKVRVASPALPNLKRFRRTFRPQTTSTLRTSVSTRLTLNGYWCTLALRMRGDVHGAVPTTRVMAWRLSFRRLLLP